MCRTAKILSLLVLLIWSHLLSAQVVYVTRTGKKYHSDGCRYLSRSRIEVDLQKAVSFGYGACSVCSPPSGDSSPTQQRRVVQNATSTQCTGRTKSGNRCKRMTTNANGRCYQH